MFISQMQLSEKKFSSVGAKRNDKRAQYTDDLLFDVSFRSEKASPSPHSNSPNHFPINRRQNTITNEDFRKKSPLKMKTPIKQLAPSKLGISKASSMNDLRSFGMNLTEMSVHKKRITSNYSHAGRQRVKQ
jgi:hypothetical protein